MEKVNVFKATPGMVLAREVVNRDGRRLFDPGLALTEKQIRILKMWGIHEVAVELPDACGDLSADGKTDSGEAIAFLNRHFADNDLSNPVVRTVFDLCRQRYETDRYALSESLKNYQNRLKPVKTPRNAPKLTPDDLASLLKDDLKLPSLPTIFFEINSAAKNPRFSGKDIADVVSKDPSLSATLLKIVNSAFFGLPEPVDSLAYAAMALGSRQVCLLALGITVVNYFKGMPSGIINMESFWRHSMACGIAARTLATHVRDVNSERVFIGGLLHDIGRLVFFSAFPETSISAVALAVKLKLPLHQVESRCFGMTHAQFGGQLAETWNFSPEIGGLVAQHHDSFKDQPSREVALVHFSNWLVNALDIGSAGEQTLPRFNIRAWQAMEISHSVLALVVRQVDRQIMETIRYFYE